MEMNQKNPYPHSEGNQITAGTTWGQESFIRPREKLKHTTFISFGMVVAVVQSYSCCLLCAILHAEIHCKGKHLFAAINTKHLESNIIHTYVCGRPFCFHGKFLIVN